VQAWTDYPLCKDATISGPVLDEPGKPAPIREVEVLGWDGNKYARVKFEQGTYTFKVGYLYTKSFRLTRDFDGDIPSVDTKSIPVIDVYAEDNEAHWDGERWVCNHCNEPIDW